MFELHFSTTKVSASIHRQGCAHGRPNAMKVIPLQGDTIEQAQFDDQVLDLTDREYRVSIAPCATKGAAK
jgi:hypothetical protein